MPQPVPGLTVIRTLVRIDIMPGAPPIAYGGQIVLAGAGVITGDAFAAGAVPDLLTDTDYPVNGWMFKIKASITNDTGGLIIAEHMEGDFRSQRKLDEQTEVFMSVENAPAAGTAFNVRIHTMVRMLVKIP